MVSNDIYTLHWLREFILQTPFLILFFCLLDSHCLTRKQCKNWFMDHIKSTVEEKTEKKKVKFGRTIGKDQSDHIFHCFWNTKQYLTQNDLTLLFCFCFLSHHNSYYLIFPHSIGKKFLKFSPSPVHSPLAFLSLSVLPNSYKSDNGRSLLFLKEHWQVQ